MDHYVPNGLTFLSHSLAREETQIYRPDPQLPTIYLPQFTAPVLFCLMDDVDMLQELESLAAELAIEIRYEHIEGMGGLCRYGGKAHLIMPVDLPRAQRINSLIDALARQPTDEIFLRPDVRNLLESRNKTR